MHNAVQIASNLCRSHSKNILCQLLACWLESAVLTWKIGSHRTLSIIKS